MKTFWKIIINALFSFIIVAFMIAYIPEISNTHAFIIYLILINQMYLIDLIGKK